MKWLAIRPGSPVGPRDVFERAVFDDLKRRRISGERGASTLLTRILAGDRARAYYAYTNARTEERAEELESGELIESPPAELPTISPRREWLERDPARRFSRVEIFARLMHDLSDPLLARDFLRDVQVMIVVRTTLDEGTPRRATGRPPHLGDVAGQLGTSARSASDVWARLSLLDRVARAVVNSYGVRGGLQFTLDAYAALGALEASYDKGNSEDDYRFGDGRGGRDGDTDEDEVEDEDESESESEGEGEGEGEDDSEGESEDEGEDDEAGDETDGYEGSNKK